MKTYVEVDKSRVGRTYQRHVGCSKGICEDRRRGGLVDAALSDFPKANVPIHPGGAKDQSEVADSRGQASVYRQAAHKFSSAVAADGWLHGGISKFPDDASSGSISEKGQAWLTELVRYKSGCSTVLIDYRHRRFRRRIDF